MFSRLDRMIRRLRTQRACLDWAVGEIADLPGPILEFGLGSGRSYDHLRKHLPERDIFVYDRVVVAHPDCIPPDDRLVVGEFAETLPDAAVRFAGAAALIHADIGSHDGPASRALAAELAPLWVKMLKGNAVLLSDQPLTIAGLGELPLPPEAPGHYFLFRRAPLDELGA
ncbi:MAG: hypothetical protein JO163_12695 [Methylobacteriaceae bacterium]|nr:hypothetical protein [Methylobacteriaceae bacterium]